uniref:Uncharacterized protein LOC114336611 n=1 Tax=Diabrotica virgifera virgifera TaxID=50390 RepID=A0A6P7GD11_DIAVI
MSNLIPESNLQTLKCALCNNYLSVPPIMTISRDAQRHKCGRCQLIPSDMSVRNTLYENLAQLSTFPCTFPDCKETLKWGEVEAHEKVCLYKTLRCPVSWKCNDQVSIKDLTNHCMRYHGKNVSQNQIVATVEETTEKNKITIMLLVHKEKPFLVFRIVTSDNIWIKVFSLTPVENCYYELSINSDASTCSLFYKNPVEVYIESRHCKKCTMNECDNKLHKKYKKKIDDAAADNGFHKVTKEMVAELNMKEIRCRIVDEE